jgi:hypothetical protein
MIALGSRSHFGVAETNDVIRLAISTNRPVAALEWQSNMSMISTRADNMSKKDVSS